MTSAITRYRRFDAEQDTPPSTGSGLRSQARVFSFWADVTKPITQSVRICLLLREQTGFIRNGSLTSRLTSLALSIRIA